jgi:hypothetical protein
VVVVGSGARLTLDVVVTRVPELDGRAESPLHAVTTIATIATSATATAA